MECFLKKKFILFTLVGILIIPYFLFPQKANAVPDNQFPRLANYFLQWRVSDEQAKELAKWDVVILGSQIQLFNPNVFKIIRQKNPDVKILAYISTEELSWTDKDLPLENPKGALYQEVNKNNWWLYNPQGGHVNFWPGTWMINVTNETRANSRGEHWSDYLARFVKEKIIATGYWDGIFYDNCFDGVQWIQSGNMDINRDGQKDDINWVNRKWRETMTNLLVKTRQYIGQDKLIVINSSNFYAPYINGRLLEGFPYGYNQNWVTMMKDYQSIIKNSYYQPKIIINNGNTNNIGYQKDYQRMRYSFASTLLNDGYFSFDFGDQNHGQTWWYDEYNVFLDQPISKAYNIEDKNNFQIKEGVWRRDFKKGVVLVNSTSQNKSINLGEELEKIRGTQDKQINDGMRVYAVDLPPYDGLILLRPAHEIIGSRFTNGSFARVFNSQGQQVRSSFFAYQSEYKGGTDILIKDLNKDGLKEVIVTEGNKIKIYNKENKLIKEFYPYTERYKREVSFSVGDLDGDGFDEIVTGTGQGGGPHVRIFSWNGKLIHPGFFAYSKYFRGGVNVACGDLDGDGKDEIITGAGFGGGPHVRVFTGSGKVIGSGFFAFDSGQRKGVKVIANDLDGDGRAEIIATSTSVFTTVMFK